jgi:hypothetical protein
MLIVPETGARSVAFVQRASFVSAQRRVGPRLSNDPNVPVGLQHEGRACPYFCGSERNQGGRDQEGSGVNRSAKAQDSRERAHARR